MVIVNIYNLQNLIITNKKPIKKLTFVYKKENVDDRVNVKFNISDR